MREVLKDGFVGERWKDKITVPDISYLTSVDLPPVLDLRDSQGTVSLLKSLLVEEQGIEPKYLGAFLFGSVARGTAKNGSDIDLFHVYDGFPKKFKAVEARLGAIFGLYGIETTQLRKTVDLEIARRNGTIFFPVEHLLDKFTQPLLLDPSLVEIIKKSTGYHTQEPNIDRPGKTPAMETGPHLLRIGQGGIPIPSWSKHSLLRQ